MQIEECAICLEPLNNKNNKTLSCTHTYHVKCIEKWKVKRKSCPICRNNSNHNPNVFSFANRSYGNLEPGFGSIDFTYIKDQIWRCLRRWRRRRHE